MNFFSVFAISLIFSAKLFAGPLFQNVLKNVIAGDRSSLKIAGDTLYTGNAYWYEGQPAGVGVYSVADPLHPQYMRLLPDTEGELPRLVTGSFLYTTRYDHLSIYDISTPNSPQPIDRVAIPSTWKYANWALSEKWVVAIQDEIEPGIRIFSRKPDGKLLVHSDVKYPEGFQAVSPLNSVTIQGDRIHALVTSYCYAVMYWSFDISNPSSYVLTPIVGDQENCAGSPSVIGDKLFLSLHSTLDVFDISDPTTMPTLVSQNVANWVGAFHAVSPDVYMAAGFGPDIYFANVKEKVPQLHLIQVSPTAYTNSAVRRGNDVFVLAATELYYAEWKAIEKQLPWNSH